MKTFSLSLCIALFLGYHVANGQTWYEEALARIDQHRKADVTVVVKDLSGNPVEGASVRLEMKAHRFKFGTAIKASRINGSGTDNEIYRQKILENFNAVVFENDLKWPAWIGLWGNNFNWPNTLDAMDWCDQNQVPIRGHYAAWATWSGADAFGASDDDSTVLNRLYSHMSDKLPTVGNRVTEWDVINHPVGWLGDTYQTRFGNQVYGDIVDHARTLVPSGMDLWINEDNILAGGGWANQYESVINNLIAQGSPVDGIGFQCHFVEEWGRIRSGEHVYNQLVRFGNLIPRLQITEFDVDVGTDEQRQANLLHYYFVAAFSHPDLEAIMLWGFWENAHWRTNAALLRSDWTAKPSYDAYRDLVYGDWWTDETESTNASGEVDLCGFLGDYVVTVEHEGKSYLFEYSLDALDQFDVTVGEIIVPDLVTPAPSTTILSGDVTSLTESDNIKIVGKTGLGRTVSLEVQATSSTASPVELSIHYEGGTRASMSDVTQEIELFDFDVQAWELVDLRDAKVLGQSLTDGVTEVEATGDLSRFVEPGTLQMRARVRLTRSGLTRRLIGFYDRIFWRVR